MCPVAAQRGLHSPLRGRRSNHAQGLCGGLVFSDIFGLSLPASGEPVPRGRHRRSGAFDTYTVVEQIRHNFIPRLRIRQSAG